MYIKSSYENLETLFYALNIFSYFFNIINNTIITVIVIVIVIDIIMHTKPHTLTFPCSWY